MTRLRDLIRQPANAFLGKMGVRLVGRDWGPRGFQAAARNLRRMGITPHEIVDVGAAHGTWTRECLEVFPDAKYLMVDPLAANQPVLSALAAERPGQIAAWHGALGRQAGRMAFHSHGDQSSFLASEYTEGESAIEVPVQPMDAFLEQGLLRAPDFIKLDVQGYEIEVLEGAARCLESAQFVFSEVFIRRVYKGMPLAHDIVAYLGARGFRILDFCSYVLRPYDGQLAGSDILFAREGSPVFQHEGWE